MINLKRPELNDQKIIEAFLHSYSQDNDWIAGSSALHKHHDDITGWILLMQNYANGEDLPPGRVPLIQYLVLNKKGVMVGVANLRLELNPYLIHSGGHIGYAVHPNYRQQGIATAVLAKLLRVAKAKGIAPLLLTCAEENLVSAKIIEAAGGKLEDKRLQKGVWVKRYWIDNQ